MRGGGGCGEKDWEGTETFLITESAHPSVAAGCTYTLEATGTWLRTEGGEEESSLPTLPPTQ